MIPAPAPGPIVAALTAPPASRNWIGGCIAEGPSPSCTVVREVPGLRSATVHVTAGPGQRASAYWAVICDGGSRFGTAAGSVPLHRELRLPSARPGGCWVAVQVRLASGGSVTVWVTAGKR